MKRFAFAVPGDIATPTGGYIYDRRIIAELQAMGWQVDVVSLGEGFPRPTAEQRAFALSKLMALPKDMPVVVDGLALGALPEEAEKVSGHRPLIALVHHPLALETGLPPANAKKLFDSERETLSAVHAVIVTSPYTGHQLSEEYDVPADVVTVVPPGTDRGAPAKGSTDGTMRLLSVGAVTPRKGFDILIAALAPIAHLPWRLTIAGDLTRDPATAAKLQEDILRHKLAGRVDLLGTVPQARLADIYAAADIFVLASHFEGYGMAYAEAMAHGLPIVGTTGGATADTVPPHAGVLIEPGNVKALTRTLKLLIENKKKRRWLAAGALEASAALATWKGSAEIFAGVVEGFL